MSSPDVRPMLEFGKEDPREKAFRAIEAVLREDPVLSRVVQTWRSREGSPDDLTPPSYGQMPLVGLSPMPRPNQMSAIDETRIDFAVSVQLFVPGSCSADILGLWGAVEDAIVRSRPFRNSTVGEFLAGCLDPSPKGYNRVWPSAPAFFGVQLDPNKQDNNPTWQGGVGMLSGFITRPA